MFLIIQGIVFKILEAGVLTGAIKSVVDGNWLWTFIFILIYLILFQSVRDYDGDRSGV